MPEDDPLSVEDLTTTVYNQLGIVADKELMAPGDRPMEIVDGGKVVKELLFRIPDVPESQALESTRLFGR